MATDEEVKRVFAEFGIQRPRQQPEQDPTEKIFLVDLDEYDETVVAPLTQALRRLIPHKKVVVVPNIPPWESEPI